VHHPGEVRTENDRFDPLKARYSFDSPNGPGGYPRTWERALSYCVIGFMARVFLGIS